MKLRNDIRQRMESHFKPGETEYDKIIKAATVLNSSVSDVIDFAERNWEEDKFRFNDEKEVLENIYINFLDDEDGNPSAVIVKSEFSYLDLATAISLNLGLDPSDIPNEVWGYVVERSDPPETADITEKNFSAAEKIYVDFKPDFSNLDSIGPGFCKDHIKTITEHLTELGYFSGRSA